VVLPVVAGELPEKIPMVQKLLRNNFIHSQLIKSNQGFTVIEILVALVLVVLVLSMALSDTFSGSTHLDDESEKIERALRFMGDEAALRNSVVRLHFVLNNAPQEYAVEYGPSDSFILPPEPEYEASLSKDEQEKADAETKKVNQQFNKVQEYQDSNSQVAEDVKILGVGNSVSKRFKEKGDIAVYAYPSGEKDDALILLADDEAIVSFEVDAFSQKIEKRTHKLENLSNREITDLQTQKAKEIFETWLKDK
jgi:prepilin-type N-terminal cleavage/methylation domain-containing protein